MKNFYGSLGDYEPAMSFIEIAERLGISPCRAHQLYTRAIHKLRNNPATLELHSILQAQQSVRRPASFPRRKVAIACAAQPAEIQTQEDVL